MLQPVKPETFTLDSNLPYTLAFIGYRLPGTDSPDFAAARILADVLASQRGDLYALVPAGKALARAIRADRNVSQGERGSAVSRHCRRPPIRRPSSPACEASWQITWRTGFPAELVDAAKRGEIASAAFQRNSIPGLAAAWSQALAAEGRNSPDEDVDAIRRVTVADVNRVARQYLVDTNSISATLVPKPSGEPASSKGFGGSEQLTSAPTKPVVLPPWAESRAGLAAGPADRADVDRQHAPEQDPAHCQDRAGEPDGHGTRQHPA